MLKISLALFLAVCAPASAQAPQRKQGAPPVRTQPTAGRGAVTRQPPVLGDDISRLIDRFSSAGGLNSDRGNLILPRWKGHCAIVFLRRRCQQEFLHRRNAFGIKKVIPQQCIGNMAYSLTRLSVSFNEFTNGATFTLQWKRTKPGLQRYLRVALVGRLPESRVY